MGGPFWIAEIIDQAKNMERFSLHTFALLADEATLHRILYWYGLFSHQRDTLAWKGFAAVLLDMMGDQAALIALGSA